MAWSCRPLATIDAPRATLRSLLICGGWLFLRTWVMLLKPNPHECESARPLPPYR